MTLFHLLTFIIIIIIVLLSDSLTTALIIISLLTNFLIISAHFGKLSRNFVNINMDIEPDITPVDIKEDSDHHDLYGPAYEQHHAYENSYSLYNEHKPLAAFSSSEQTYNIDAANAHMASRRARDKKCSDGWAIKDTNYYKYHFADELAEAEAKRWWGASEI